MQEIQSAYSTALSTGWLSFNRVAELLEAEPKIHILKDPSFTVASLCNFECL